MSIWDGVVGAGLSAAGFIVMAFVLKDGLIKSGEAVGRGLRNFGRGDDTDSRI